MKVYIVTEDHFVDKASSYEGGWHEQLVAVYANLDDAKRHVAELTGRDGWIWHETSGDGDYCLRQWIFSHPDLQQVEIDQHFSIQEWAVEERKVQE